MPSTNIHGLVTGFHRDDHERYRKIPVADIRAGNCVACKCTVFLNPFGVTAVRERDADVICRRCDRIEGLAVDRTFIES